MKMTEEEKFWKWWEKMEKRHEKEWKEAREAIKEARKEWKEVREAMKEARKEWKEEIKESRKEWKEAIKESRKEWKEEMKEARKEWERGMKELREAMKETDRRMKETDRRMKETDRKIGKLTDGWGMFVEGVASPGAVKSFLGMGYRIIDSLHRRKIWKNGRPVVEFDTMIEAEKDGTKFLIIGEAASNMSSSKISDFINEIRHLKEYLPEYKNWKVMGFVVGMNYGRGADIYAINQGLYVFKPSGETVVLDVPEKFIPTVWE